jgi:ribosomal protein S27AE
MTECERCGSTYILNFSQLDHINDVGYRRLECGKCGFFRIFNSASCSTMEGINESIKQLYNQMSQRGMKPKDLKPKRLLSPMKENALRLLGYYSQKEK